MKLHFILPWAMLSFLMFLEQPLSKPQTQGKVNFVGGEIDVDERVAIQASRADYNLSLLYLMEDTEEYLGDLQGSIKDANGNTFLGSVSDGLMLFSEFRPGRDITSAVREGQWIDKTVNVGGKTAASSMRRRFPWDGARNPANRVICNTFFCKGGVVLATSNIWPQGRRQNPNSRP